MRTIFFILMLFVSRPMFGSSFDSEVAPSVKLALEWVRSRPIPPPAFAYVIHRASTVANDFDKQHSNFDFASIFIVMVTELEPSWNKMPEEASVRGITSQEKLQKAKKLLEKEIAIEKRVLAEAKSRGTFVASSIPGRWRPTGSQRSDAVLTNWGSIKLESHYDPLLKGFTPLSIHSSEFFTELLEVREMGDRALFDAQASATASFWAAGPKTVTPPGMWIEATLEALSVASIADTQKRSILFGLSQALSVAGVLCWRIKYEHGTWRPVTAIRDALGDLNWNPRIETPSFPSYVSGHSTFSAAAATFLEKAGVKSLSFQDEFRRMRKFNSLRKAALEAGESRILGGIHFRTDNTHGLMLGERIGSAVYEAEFRKL
jgi:hypothetical protein